MRNDLEIITQFFRALETLEKGNLQNYPVVYIYNTKIFVELMNKKMFKILGANSINDMFDKIININENNIYLNKQIADCKNLYKILETLNHDLTQYNIVRKLDFDISEIKQLYVNFKPN
ncbi:hypothetical protein [Campylobacter sputorum]|uniref:hypothetical protein n=1 Tax=Campylobacter sputorum TaxID=206 RepID=UPI00053BE2E7|nr:hypothetical protein [Campylobacter sputorum]